MQGCNQSAGIGAPLCEKAGQALNHSADVEFRVQGALNPEP